MIAAYRNKAIAGVMSGLPVAFTGSLLPRLAPAMPVVSAVGFSLVLIGMAMFVWGCCKLMLAKGHSEAWGLLGLFNVYGLFVLLLFTDHRKDGVDPATARGFDVLPLSPLESPQEL